MLENDAGRTLELVDDDTLRAVDDERALFGHQRQRAEVDILFLAVAEGAVARALFHIVHVKADLDADRCLVGQPLGNAFRLIVLGFADFIAQVFKACGAVEILNGKDGTEHSFQSHLGVAILAAFLQEDIVRVHLKVEQVRYGERHLDFPNCFVSCCIGIPQDESCSRRISDARVLPQSRCAHPVQARCESPADTQKRRQKPRLSRWGLADSVTVTACNFYTKSFACMLRPLKNKY